MISKLVHCVKSSITIHVMNVSKQAGAVNCALFAVAIVTSLALGDDSVAMFMTRSNFGHISFNLF